MNGEFIKVIHQCETPNANEQGLGSIWKCDCNKEWTSAYDRDLGKFWYWSNRPPIIYKTKPTIWQSLIALIKGEK